jgi:hypothetical protein
VKDSAGGTPTGATGTVALVLFILCDPCHYEKQPRNSKKIFAAKELKELKEKACDVSSLHGNPALQSDKAPQFREDSNTDDGRIFNAKSQRHSAAKPQPNSLVQCIAQRRRARRGKNLPKMRNSSE